VTISFSGRTLLYRVDLVCAAAKWLVQVVTKLQHVNVLTLLDILSQNKNSYPPSISVAVCHIKCDIITAS